MSRANRFHLAASILVAVSSVAQAQNPVVFVGTSTSGSTDRHFFVDAISGAVVQAGGNSFTDNVSDAAWADHGANLYVSQSLQNRVSRAQWNGASASWSTFYPAPGACYGVGIDAARKVLWVLTGATGSDRELHCIDADTSSANYGQLIVQTTSLAGVSRERWELSPSGDLAAVPHVFLQSGLFEIVDTNPASANYLQVVVSTPVFGASGSFSFASDCAFTHDDQYALLLYTGIGPSAVAALHVPTGTWLDFDTTTPGQQDFVLSSSVPNTFALSDDDSFAVIGVQGGGGSAWRLDLDYATPSNSTLTEYLGGAGLLPNANAASLSSGAQYASFSATPANLSGPSFLVTVDATTGALVSNVQLDNAWNVYTSTWQELCPPPVSYCTSGVTTNGCTASMESTGIASATASSGFVLRAVDVEGAKQGLIFYSVSGRAASPWGTSSSFLCIKAPTQRTPPQQSGGTHGACDGLLSVDWSAYVAANPGALGAPFSVGDQVQAQAWFRDPPSPKTTMLSDAIEFEVCP